MQVQTGARAAGGLSRKWLAALALGVLLLGFAMVVSTWDEMASADASRIGYIDAQLISDAYVQPAIEPGIAELRQEQGRLQAEIDERIDELSDDELQALVDEYQGILDEREAELEAFIEEVLDHVRSVTQQVARRHGVDVVLQHQVVIVGGVDLTEEVLQELEASR